MACEHWNPEWVARLYDELDPQEEQRAAEHVAGCADCRTTLEQLAASRRTLYDSAPEIPAAPRVVVLPPKRSAHPAWAFAAGIGLAASLFVGGWLVGVRGVTPAVDGMDGAAASEVAAVEALRSRPTHGEMQAALEAQQKWFEEQLAEVRQSASRPEPQVLAASMTPDQLDDAMRRLERKITLERARDFEFLVGEIAATERRAGTWVDETRNALRYVALQSDGRLSER